MNIPEIILKYLEIIPKYSIKYLERIPSNSHKRFLLITHQDSIKLS